MRRHSYKKDWFKETMLLTSPMDLKRPSGSADVLGRYYTPPEVSQTLIDAMMALRPKLVLELGAGQGSLASAAYRKWKNANFVTVDMDSAVKTVLGGITSRPSHIHHSHDALDDELADRIGIPLGSVDVGLCNPPYIRPRWKSSFGHILEDAGLSGALQSVHDAGADLLFIAQNLRLLRHQGKLGLIIPDGLITGQKYKGVREVLLREHRVELVVQLPRRVFANTEAQTYLMILSKRAGETQQVLLSQMTDSGEMSIPISVEADVAKLRLDFSYHILNTAKTAPGKTILVEKKLYDIVSDIFRGSTSSSQIEACPLPVFHLGDFPKRPESSPVPKVPTKFIQSASKTITLGGRYRIAKAGDILIARIGRNLHEKVCLLTRGSCVISDCIFAIRTPTQHRDAVLAYLLSNDGREALKAASHGVGAQYLSQSDVLGLTLPS